jgi:hypothetical protein
MGRHVLATGSRGISSSYDAFSEEAERVTTDGRPRHCHARIQKCAAATNLSVLRKCAALTCE